MKLLFIIFAIITLTTGDKRCHGVYFDDKYYNLYIIKEGIHNLHDFAYNKNDNTIYFTYETLSEKPLLLLGYFDVGTRTVGTISGIRNATSVTIDQFYGKVYVGGADGLYKINDQKVPERLPIQEDVKSVYFRDGLYFTNRKREVYKFEDGYASLVPEMRGVEADKIVIDDDSNMFFTQNKKLFRIKMGTRAINTHEMHTVDALTTDIYHKPYICTAKGVYVYNKYKYVFDKVSDIARLKALAFSKMNEPIYAVADLFVRLELSPIGCFED
ncbi:unnamed protein product [Colias eurytheme]|nr:unnamed protein product [Colias eurytheme]